MLKLKHSYRVESELTFVDIETKKGIKTFVIDTEDIPKVLKYKWYITDKGYVKNKTVGLLHRFLIDCPKNKIVDHRSHNKLNNCKSNLRICNKSENGQNRLGFNTYSATKIRGIYYNRRDCRYYALLTLKGQKHYVGSFTTKKEAEKAIIERRKQLMPFSEMDFNPNSEFLQNLKEKENEIAKKITKIKLPIPLFNCCRINHSTALSRTHKLFKCFLHYPWLRHYEDKEGQLNKVKFQITFRANCLNCEGTKLITYFYNNNNNVIAEQFINKNDLSIKYLKLIDDLFIKPIEIPFPGQDVKIPKGKNCNWYYGVPICEGFFKKVSLDNTFTDENVYRTKILNTNNPLNLVDEEENESNSHNKPEVLTASG